MSPRDEHGGVSHACQREEAFSCGYFQMRKVQRSVLLEMPSHSADEPQPNAAHSQSAGMQKPYRLIICA